MVLTKSFACTKCAACCRRVSSVYPGWPTRPDGACIALQADDTCGVYDVRPAVCRVDDALPSGMTLKEWHRANAEACNGMQEEDGTPESFRVIVE